MPRQPEIFRPHATPPENSYERERGSAAARLYDRRWRKAARLHLARSPLCRYCELEGRVTAATLVDHLYPHRSNVALFWASGWWVSACKSCHDGFKQAIEREGRSSLDALASRLGLKPMCAREPAILMG